MKRHISKEHGRGVFRNDLHGGGVHDEVRRQSWTQNGAGGYWIVDSRDSLLARLAAACSESSPRRQRRVAKLCEAETHRLAEGKLNRSATDAGIDDLALASNWMRRTNWARTFDGVDRRLLMRLAEHPAPNGRRLVFGSLGTNTIFSDAMDEQRLLDIGPAIDRFFDRCEDPVRHTDTSTAERIAEEIGEWPGIIPYPSLSELLSFVTKPIPQLLLFDDGLQCRLDPIRCRHITRDVKSLKGHWRTSHNGWSVQQSRGGPGAVKRAAMQERFN